MAEENQNALSKKRTWIISLLGTTAFLLTTAHFSLYVNRLSFLYLVNVAIMFTVLVVFVFHVGKGSESKVTKSLVVCAFLTIYILLTAWLGIKKTVPEYKEIVDFQKQRSELIYELTQRVPSMRGVEIRKLAILYMHAEPSVQRIEPRVNHRGVMMMKEFLNEKIEEGEGQSYANDMYDMAEIAFTQTGIKFARDWYEKAYKYGRSDAMERYNARMSEYNNLK